MDILGCVWASYILQKRKEPFHSITYAIVQRSRYCHWKRTWQGRVSATFLSNRRHTNTTSQVRNLMLRKRKCAFCVVRRILSCRFSKAWNPHFCLVQLLEDKGECTQVEKITSESSPCWIKKSSNTWNFAGTFWQTPGYNFQTKPQMLNSRKKLHFLLRNAAA